MPRTLFQWVGLSVVAIILSAFWLGSRMLFVAGAITLLGFAAGTVQSAVHLRRTRPGTSALDLLPHASLLALVAVLLYLLDHELLRK
jgi:formate-dependent nitrite reductase membrane component NrfD